MKCPGCGCENPTDAHLVREYNELMRAGFGNMFGHNARRACNAVVDALAERGIMSEETIFGVREFRKWTY